MKKTAVLAVLFMIVALLMSVVSVAVAETGVSVTADEALALMMAGNQRYAQGNLAGLIVGSKPAARQALTGGQKPYAIVVDCSDSRVSPEIVFDKGLGEVFVIRVAGNVVAPHELGSIEYAVEHIGSPLIMVLGHSKCGAVTASVDAKADHSCHVPYVNGNIGSLVNDIAPAVEEACEHDPSATRAELIAESIDANIKLVAEKIEADSPIVKEAVEAGHVKIIKARYDLEDGIVKLLGE